MSYNCVIDDGWYNPEWWLKCTPRPHLLDVLIQVLSGGSTGDGGEGTGVSTNVIEDLLPDLCFSLPHRAQGCVTLLNSLSQKSVVWDKLEEGLIKKKHLPVEVTVALYTTRSTTLENEVIRVLSLYASQTCNEDWRKRSCFTVAHFMSTIETGGGGDGGSGDGSDGGDGGDGGGGGGNLASNSTRAVLSLKNTDSSKSVVSGLGDEYFQNDVQVSMVQEALTEALMAENGMEMIKAILCFFPFWLPVLQQRKFLDKYLVDWWCDS
ncbi:hypothetical protein Pcinc_031742 [Petrolisthes cinctipes]|uniref:Uncharacterized protein n=1 Tax=Petrolisthes cinctipes TaxID=88211 RepID=A0AAE1EVI9_PETCI|nr:hypothetical protein Pcinc_031742 [Petrolisthes cinctipes]